MEKEKLPPIPTPVSQRWREFRIQVLPFVLFLSLLVGIVYLWKSYVQPVGIIGSAETNLVNVTSLQDGMISELFVERFQNVTAGQEIAIVVNTDPELIKAQIESVQADIKVLKARNDEDVRRADQSNREFRQDLLTLRVEQAEAHANWYNVSNVYQRALNEYNDKVGTLAAVDAGSGW